MRENLRVGKQQFADAGGMNRFYMCSFEGWDDGKKRKRKVTEELLTQWYRCYRTLLDENGRKAEMSEEDVLNMLRPVEERWNLDRSLGRDVALLDFWGDSLGHQDFRMGVERVCSALGMRCRYQAFGGRGNDLAAELEHLASSQKESVIITLPPLHESWPSLVAALDKVALAASRKPRAGSDAFRAVVSGLGTGLTGFFGTYERVDSVADGIATAICDAASNDFRVLALASGGSPITSRRAEALQYALSKKLRGSRKVMHDFRSELLSTLNLKEAVKLLEGMVGECAPRSASEPELFVASLFFGCTDLLCRRFDRLPERVRVVSTDMTDGWIKPLIENEEAWLGTAAVDLTFQGSVAAALLEWACVAAEGDTSPPDVTDVQVPVRFIRSGEVTGMTSMQEVRAELLSTPVFEVAETFPWMHYLPAALAVPKSEQASKK